MSLAQEEVEAVANITRADHFRFDTCAFDLHFPCAVCIHRDKPEGEVCTGCRFYFD